MQGVRWQALPNLRGAVLRPRCLFEAHVYPSAPVIPAVDGGRGAGCVPHAPVSGTCEDPGAARRRMEKPPNGGRFQLHQLLGMWWTCEMLKPEKEKTAPNLLPVTQQFSLCYEPVLSLFYVLAKS